MRMRAHSLFVRVRRAERERSCQDARHGCSSIRFGGMLLGVRGPDREAESSSGGGGEAAAEERLSRQDSATLGMLLRPDRDSQAIAGPWSGGSVLYIGDPTTLPRYVFVYI